jgi:hypothetical protein
MQSPETQKKFADLKNGPVDNSSRFCTDFLCLLLFLLCFGGIIAIANYGYHNGQLSKIA